MSLTSLSFISLFTILYVILLILNKAKINYTSIIPRIILLLGSYFFIGIVDYRFLLCILAFTIVTYLISVGISQNNKKSLLVIGLIICVLQLCFFKYFDFFVNSFRNAFGLDTVTLRIFLPIGISFYTFSAISYLVDVYKKKEKIPNIIDYGLYIAFFTKLTCGPIVRIRKYLDEQKKAQLSYENFEFGIQKFAIGLFKKMVIADHISIFVNDVFNYTNAFSGLTVLGGVFSYSLLIYFDFSGYSDMAIGLSKILGFNFDNNFNLPYISKNPSEFWKRWHISLSSWLQDYIYIPLGGNRKGVTRTYINLFLTMLIGGLWHGANWTFIIWGAINGVALCIHKLYSKCRKKYFNNIENNRIYTIVCTLLTFIFISFTWIFFRADSLLDAINVISRIIRFEPGISVLFSWSILGLAVLIVEIIISTIKNKKTDIYYPHLKFDRFWQLTLFLIFVGIIIIMAYVGETQFIYGNF